MNLKRKYYIKLYRRVESLKRSSYNCYFAIRPSQILLIKLVQYDRTKHVEVDPTFYQDKIAKLACFLPQKLSSWLMFLQKDFKKQY